MEALAGSLETRFSNRILNALPQEELACLWPNLVRVRLVNGQELHGAGERMTHVLFLERGFMSMIAEANGPDDVIEIGLVGPESMVGLSVLFSERAVSYSRGVVQAAGSGYAMPVEAFVASMGQMPVLRRLLYRAMELAVAQAVQTAACNGRHNLRERMARWLLMAHDRVEGDELLFTQQMMSVVLAVRRAGVTVTLQGLEQAGLVRHSRGRVRICDRPGLEAAACACYGRLGQFSQRVCQPYSQAA